MLLPRIIATAVDKIARQAVGKEWNLYATLLDHWAEIVGEDYARVTTPVKITLPNPYVTDPKLSKTIPKQGVLHIRLPQGLAMEFSFLTGQIQQRINAFFGYQAITRIVFEPFYGAPKALEQQESTIYNNNLSASTKEELDTIDEEELRESLARLGNAIFKGNKTT